jgi:hypothetical protein
MQSWSIPMPQPLLVIWYLPHHGETTPTKHGKVRVVLNPSARFRGSSLNEELYKGPDLLTPLVGFLLRFRQCPVTISEYIQKMYHQVKVPEHQQSLLRFLWKEPESEGEPTGYQMMVHVFGAFSFPTSFIYALKRNPEDFRPQFPEATKRVLNNIYADNYLDSVETAEKTIIQR